ncbi:hypothetical protein [Rhodohalobacter sp.]
MGFTYERGIYPGEENYYIYLAYFKTTNQRVRRTFAQSNFD